MQVFQQALAQVHPSSFNPEASQHIQQIRLSSDVSSILRTIKENENNVFIIHGEPGTGCSTLVQGLCQCLCNTETITISDILYLSLNQGCSNVSIWDFMGKLAKERNDQETATKFTQTSLKIDIKIKALSEFLEQHWKVICVDNADYSESWILDSFLGDVLKTCKATSFLVLQTQTHGLHIKYPTTDIVYSTISVDGLTKSSSKALASTLLHPHVLNDEDITSLCNFVKSNPFGIKLLCGLLKGQNEDMVASEILQNQHSTELLNVQSCALDRVIELASKALTISSIDMLYKLSSLRRPLPMMQGENSEVKELALAKLVCMKKEGRVLCIYLHPTLKKYLSSKKNPHSCKETDFDVLQHWLSLVSNKDLQKLICEAENNDWPFVPEKWQFVQDVSKEQGTNVKESIVSINTNIPTITELQILQECLYHSYIQDNFQKLAAVLFVLDRFLFWQGDTKTSMDIVTYIQKKSPQTAIAPQLLVRKARVLKNEGNLRVAEEILDEILDEVTRDSHGVGRWKYKTRDQFQLTKAACIQLKGEIQYSLGNWLKSAELLLQSIELFANLSRPDKKGLSLGYGLLCPCLRNMTVQDYSSLANSFGLVKCHPLLAAYISAQEAARSSTYTPMFFVRHTCHAGEVMMQFIKLSTLEDERQQLLKVATEDIRDSIQSHQTYKALTSKEQFYIFVLASYKLSLALLDLQTTAEQETGHKLNAISVELFEHYCSSSGHVIIDDHVIGLIDKCLTLLGLKKFHDENLPNAGEILLKYYTRRSAERLKENTRLTVMGLFTKGHVPLSPTSPTIYDYPESSVGIRHRFLGTNVDDTAQHRTDNTVDRYAATLEGDVEKAISGVKQDKPSYGKTVDRYSDTVEDDEKETHPDKAILGDDKTVDRHAAKVEDDVGAEHQDKCKPCNGKTVDRYSATVEDVEEETHPDKARSGDGKTVDRHAAKVEHDIEAEHQDKDKQCDGKTVDRYSATEGDDEEKTHPDKARSGDGKTVDRHAAKVEHDIEAEHQDKDKQCDGKTVDRYSATEGDDAEETHPDKAISGDGKTVDRYAAKIEHNIEAEHQDKDKKCDGKTVDRYSATEGDDEEKTHPDKARSGDGKTVDRHKAKVEDDVKAEQQDKGKPCDGKTVDQYSATVEDDAEETHPDKAISGDGKTVDRHAAKVEHDIETEHQDKDKQCDGKIVDRYSATEGDDEEKAHPDKARSGDGKTGDRHKAKVEDDVKAEQQDKGKPCDGKTVDRSATVEDDEEKTHLDKAGLGEFKTVERNAATVEDHAKERGKDRGKPSDGRTVNQYSATVEDYVEEGHSESGRPSGCETTDQRSGTIDGDEVEGITDRANTVDEYAFLLSRTVEGDSAVIVQSLIEEAVSLPSQTRELPRTVHSSTHYHGTKRDGEVLKTPRDAILWKYDYPSSQWRGQPTMVYIDDLLQLDKGKEGAQRDVFKAVFINQDEPLGRYVAKKYRKKVNLHQYENDVLSQMTARHYVALFNQSLFQAAKDVTVGEIQFLPVVLLQLFDSFGCVTKVFNAEPYMSGEFTKLTNNVDWKNEQRRTDLVLAYSHFTYQASNGKLIIVDIQGWAPHDEKGCTFLTDPQIHSTDYKCFGTGNLGKRGYQNFWKMHSKCNKICQMLGLNRHSIM